MRIRRRFQKGRSHRCQQRPQRLHRPIERLLNIQDQNNQPIRSQLTINLLRRRTLELSSLSRWNRSWLLQEERKRLRRRPPRHRWSLRYLGCHLQWIRKFRWNQQSFQELTPNCLQHQGNSQIRPSLLCLRSIGQPRRSTRRICFGKSRSTPRNLKIWYPRSLQRLHRLKRRLSCCLQRLKGQIESNPC